MDVFEVTEDDLNRLSQKGLIKLSIDRAGPGSRSGWIARATATSSDWSESATGSRKNVARSSLRAKLATIPDIPDLVRTAHQDAENKKTQRFQNWTAKRRKQGHREGIEEIGGRVKSSANGSAWCLAGECMTVYYCTWAWGISCSSSTFIKVSLLISWAWEAVHSYAEGLAVAML